MSLILYDKPAQSDAFRQNIDDLATGWRRSKLAIGGYNLGTFTVKKGGMTDWTRYYNSWMGNQIQEHTFGMTSWEGLIWQLDLVKGGINYRRTFNPQFWHNRVKIIYTDRAGDQQIDDWDENTSSSDIYGEMEMIYTMGGLHANGAAALQARALTSYAWPSSRNVGGISIGQNIASSASDGLYVTVSGFSTTLNWQYYESTQASTTASTAISNLVGTSEFVTAGRIETNSLTINADGDSVSQRLGDLITEITRQGDASGNVWKCGVYAGKEFIYEDAPTSVDYVYRDGLLYDKSGSPVIPQMLDPGFYVRDTNAPSGNQPPGTSNIWDDPQVSYCDMVEYQEPGILRLSFPGQEERVEVFFENARKQGLFFQGQTRPPAPYY